MRTATSTLLAGLVALAALVPAAASAQPPAPWVDVHAHVVGGRGPTADFGGAVECALRVMDEAGIARAVVMPPPQPPSFPALFDHEAFAHALRRHPKRFAFLGGGGSLNPMIHTDAAAAEVGESVRRRFEQTALEILKQGAAGFGEITAHHLSHAPGHPYEDVAADHPLLRLLADVAARHDAVIDLHFDVVTEEIRAPGWLASPPNPPVFRPNLAAFERLLAHNRAARIVWAHAGSDMFGHWTVDLSRRLLGAHPNLFMSLRMAPGRAPQNHPLDGDRIKPEWLRLLRDFPDRFVIGNDQFFLSPAVRAEPAITFARRAAPARQRTGALLRALPADLARAIGHENAARLYKLAE